MNIELTQAFAVGLEAEVSRRRVLLTLPGSPPAPERPVTYERAPRLLAAAPSKPVLQLNAVGMTLAPSRYANARSGSNPNGSDTSLFAFRELVNPVPAFTRYYSPSGNFTELVYGNLVNGASIEPTATYTRQVLSQAKQSFDLSALANLDGLPGRWRPVYAAPEDWYDTRHQDRFRPLDLAPTGAGADDSPYLVVGPGRPEGSLSWRIANGGTLESRVALDPATRLTSITLRYLEVTLSRPWLDFEVFALGGWYLQGQDKGHYSTGTAADNDGIMPLLPTSLIVGIDTAITADWSQADRNIVATAAARGHSLALGPFPFEFGGVGGGATFTRDALASPVLAVIGWVSALVPRSPPLAGP